VPGRYSLGIEASSTTPQQIYRQVREYREKYPEKALLHHIHADLQQTWAFLMGGGSMLIRNITYPSASIRNYNTAPLEFSVIRHTYSFVNRELSNRLPNMKPVDLARNASKSVWSLSDAKETALFFMSSGGIFDADLRAFNGSFSASWFKPSTGSQFSAGTIIGGALIRFSAPSSASWVLLIKQD
jgi:hypothetical protein